jgi:hypothetical protein
MNSLLTVANFPFKSTGKNIPSGGGSKAGCRRQRLDLTGARVSSPAAREN